MRENDYIIPTCHIDGFNTVHISSPEFHVGFINNIWVTISVQEEWRDFHLPAAAAVRPASQGRLYLTEESKVELSLS